MSAKANAPIGGYRNLSWTENPRCLKEFWEWSHVDSNHGPPACEAGALTS
jgi:hypothetical protein